MEKATENGTKHCCTKINPADWDGKEISWKGKVFVKGRVRSFFHFPLNFNAVVQKSEKAIKDAGVKMQEELMLSDESSFWHSDLFIAVDREAEGLNTCKLSGQYLTKVFEGPYHNAGLWVKEMQMYVRGKNKELKKIYFWYTTCPKCAKDYGKNHVVLFAEV